MIKTVENQKCGVSCEKRSSRIRVIAKEWSMDREWVRQILKTNMNTMKCA